eukprot:UN05638
MTTRISFTLLIRPRQNQTSHWHQYVGKIFNHCAGQLTQHSSCSDSNIHSKFPRTSTFRTMEYYSREFST